MDKCLIVVDFQNDFVDGSLGSSAAKAISEAVARKIRDRRAEGYDIIFTLDTHEPDYLQTQEGRRLPVEHCLKGTEGHRLYPPVAALAQEGDLQIEKPAFGSIELFERLRSHPYEEIELCGVVTEICVISNAVLAKTARPEASVRVDAACTAGATPEARRAALDVMRSLQIDVENDEQTET